jgi:small subunit ribosomal protein S19e
MMLMKNINPQKQIHNLAQELKMVEGIKAPTWALYVKSGVSQERPPSQSDFWYLRSAAVLRRISIDGPVGVERLRTYFGGKRRRGHKPAHHRKAGGKIIRLILQQLEKEGLIAKTEKPKKGRIITPKGRKILKEAGKVA